MAEQETMLIKVDPKANNNKFYHVTLHEDGQVEKHWGRVGSEGTTSTENTGIKGYNRIVKQKKNRGYKETEVLTDTVITPMSSSLQDVSKAAHHALVKGKRNAELDGLIENLVNNNRHEILQQSGGKITLDDTGKVKTPLGYITINNIKEARHLLQIIEEKKAYTNVDYLSDYLTLVPQKVPHQRGWYEDFFTKQTTILEQMAFLDKLQDSYEWAETELEAKKSEVLENQNPEDTSKYDSLFRLQIELLDTYPHKDEAFSHVETFFEKKKNSYHQSSAFKLNKIFVLHDETKEAEFTRLGEELGNIRELWHGTSAANVLSIMKSGLYAARGKQISNGNMYAGSIPMTYLSDQSSKSLNYSSGFWNKGDKVHNTCYMFLTDTIMGNEFRPNKEGFTGYDPNIGKYARTRKDKNGHPYNSISVKGGTVGVMNNEMLIWNPDQIRLKYLCEFIRK